MNQTLAPRSKIIGSCIIWIVICLAISGLAGWVTSHNINPWYINLQKPSFNPPAWLFAPVWTVLYIMIGISGGLLWLSRKQNTLAFAFYIIQLALNFAWSFVFFGAHQTGWAAIEILVLLVFILLTIIYSYRTSKYAAWLLMPYFAWVCFASILNISIWYLN